MKSLTVDFVANLIIILFILLLAALPARAFLSPAQSQQLTAALNDACGDSWCEGPYNIQFNSVRCSRVNHNCVVYMQLKDSYHKASLAKSSSCLIEPLNTADEVYTAKAIAASVDTFIVPSKILLNSISKCIAAYQP